MRKKLLAIFMAILMILSFLPTTVFAEPSDELPSESLDKLPGEGNIPILRPGYEIKWIEEVTEDQEEPKVPEYLAPGQIWIDKKVTNNEDGSFDIELSVWGATYTVNGETKYPLQDGTDIIITYKIGEKFKFEDSDTDTITWTVSQEDLLDGITRTYTVSLKEGWAVGEEYTIDYDTSAEFYPQGDNPFYYDYEEAQTADITLGNISWNNGNGGSVTGINTLDITDTDRSLTLIGDKDSFTVDTRTFTLDPDGTSNDFRANSDGTITIPEPVLAADDGTWGSLWDKNGDSYIYYIWFMGLEAPGTLTLYTIQTDGPGGNGALEVSSWSLPGKYVPKSDEDFDGKWVGDKVELTLPKSGKIIVISQFGTLALSAAVTQKYTLETWLKKYVRNVQDFYVRDVQKHLVPTFKKATSSVSGTLVTWRGNQTVPGGTFGNGMTWLEIDVAEASASDGISYQIADSSPKNRPIGYSYNVRIAGEELILSFDERFISADITAKLYASAPAKHDPSHHVSLAAGEELRVPLSALSEPEKSTPDAPSVSAVKDGNTIYISVTYNGSVIKTLTRTYVKNWQETIAEDGYEVNISYNGNGVKQVTLDGYPQEAVDPGNDPAVLEKLYMFVHIDGIKWFTTGEYEFVEWVLDESQTVEGEYKLVKTAKGKYKLAKKERTGSEDTTRIYDADFTLTITGPDGIYIPPYPATLKNGAKSDTILYLIEGNYTVKLSGNGIGPENQDDVTDDDVKILRGETKPLKFETVSTAEAIIEKDVKKEYSDKKLPNKQKDSIKYIRLGSADEPDGDYAVKLN